MLCDCVLIEVAVIRQEESAAPAVISCCGHDKHHRHFPGKGRWEKDGKSQKKKQKKTGQTALQLVHQLMCNYGGT